jgi:uncharacterized protein DUF3330
VHVRNLLALDTKRILAQQQGAAQWDFFGGMAMKPTTQPIEAQKVKCEVCLKEIPKSEAKCAEAVEYVAYFCGLDCYQQWQANAQAAPPRHRNKGAA